MTNTTNGNSTDYSQYGIDLEQLGQSVTSKGQAVGSNVIRYILSELCQKFRMNLELVNSEQLTIWLNQIIAIRDSRSEGRKQLRIEEAIGFWIEELQSQVNTNTTTDSVYDSSGAGLYERWEQKTSQIAQTVAPKIQEMLDDKILLEVFGFGSTSDGNAKLEDTVSQFVAAFNTAAEQGKQERRNLEYPTQQAQLGGQVLNCFPALKSAS
ncbi:hypothetical protein PL11201_530114 [Planktothrix sp. PCC 11201]|uniref:hypothetical protein n=1 Tax=Planktothrix sp. PCC 11201 TaxID=1729650 RepID=UPI00091BE7F9|nr:hypothetical protein [Planktothrix sp. PCC 11201]SKB13784.1 hypothetical protein PL11201_530114 [Planktothrix sp. PCC 11201]